MTFFARTKQVTDPLDDRVKDRIVGREPGYVSSGSEHSAGSGAYDENSSSSSPCLSNLLPCFLHRGGEEECNDNDDKCCQLKIIESDSNADLDCDSDRTDAIIEIIRSLLTNQNVDRRRLMRASTIG